MKKIEGIKKAYDAYKAASTNQFHKKREALFEAIKAKGIDGTLEVLGFPTDRLAFWYNINTGSEETLQDLLVFNPDISDEIRELGYTLENWMPKKEDPNPIMARSLALSEEDAMRQLLEKIDYEVGQSSTPDDFVSNFRNCGGSLNDGSYNARNGEISVRLHDGREFIFKVRRIFDVGKGAKQQTPLFSS